ncbi:MAG: aminotransferase class I/II-fold pyridoxal phosphate-dependent enzyme [Rhodoferax sp.]|nr:aminotransferase class I/II-fold pyridoxal phosphate-dependent enzyme [Rhodoferax sp.]
MPTILHRLAHYSTTDPDRTAFILEKMGCQPISLSYAQLHSRSNAVAAWLRQQVAAGDRVVLAFPNGLDFVVSFFGCLAAGVLAVPVPLAAKGKVHHRLNSIIHDSNPKLILTPRISVSGFAEQNVAVQAFEDIDLDGNSSDVIPLSANPDDIAYLQYTSGSTRDPKGVMVSHGNIMACCEMIKISSATKNDTRMASWLPNYHDFSLVAYTLTPVYVSTLAVLIEQDEFLQNPLFWLQVISKYKIEHSGAPNFAYDYCVKRIKDEEKSKLDLSSWRIAVNGAEPVLAKTLTRFTKAFSSCGFKFPQFVPAYGLAESTLLVAGKAHDKSIVIQIADKQALEQHRYQAAASESKDGVALVGYDLGWGDTEIRIVDPTTLHSVDEGFVGEVWVRGSAVCQGYWDRPDESSQTFHAVLSGDTKSHRYLRTGDLGFIYDGKLYITGRLKDLIIIRGRNLYPQDIEHSIELAVPDIKKPCAAFSLDVDGEERLGIAIELRSGLYEKFHQIAIDPYAFCRTLDSLVRQIRDAVFRAHDVNPYAIAFIRPGKFPVTSSGKVQRGRCRNLITAHTQAPHEPAFYVWWQQQETFAPEHEQTADGPQPSSSVLALIQKVLLDYMNMAGLATATHVDPDTPFGALGLDSLGVVALGMEIERQSNFRLDMDLIYAHDTARKLAKCLEDRSRIASEQEVPRLPDRLLGLNARVEKVRQAGLYCFQPTIDSRRGAWVTVDGKDSLVMASYSYLGLMGDPRVEQAAKDAVDQFSTGTHGARMLAGTLRLHRQLEAAIARFKGMEAALVFTSGYITNLSAIATLVGPGDTVIGDNLNHASIVDGCRFSGARFMPFHHNDLADLERCLKAAEGLRLVIVDGVFSMEGDIAPLPEIVRLCRTYGASLMVDEAHSVGVIGATGHGIVEHFGLQPDCIDIHMGTLSKTIPSSGGYIAGSHALIDALSHNARGSIFSGAMAPAQAGAALGALRVIEAQPERVRDLQAKAEYFRKGLQALQFDTFKSETAIVPIRCADESQAYRMTKSCQEKGLFVLPVVYPAVPKDAPRLRTTVTSAHTYEDIDFALRVFAEAGRACGVI